MERETLPVVVERRNPLARRGQECVSLEFYGSPIITLPRNSVACLLPKTYVRFSGELLQSDVRISPEDSLP